MSHRFKLEPVCGDSVEGSITILFEDEGNIDYVIIVDSRYHHVTSTVGCPTVFTINLEDGIYDVDWYINHSKVYSMVVNHQPNPSRLIFVSCDLKETRPRHSPWISIKNNNPHAVVHLGDNLYCDVEYANSQDKPQSVVKDYYMERYRSTWKGWIKELGGISHYFGLDDHEIVDNVHTITTNSTIVAAMDCYDMYQSSLTGSRVHKPNDGRYWSKSWVVDDCPVQMVFTDRPRMSTMCYRPEALDLVDDDTQLLILAMAVPPFITPFTGYVIPEVDNGQYSQESCIELLDILQRWRAEDDRRRVLIVSGDSHFGALADIDGIKFAISSPITNQPLAGEISSVRHLRHNDVVLGNHRINFSKCVAKRNYLIVDIINSEFVLNLVELSSLPSLLKIPSVIRFVVKS